MQLIVRKEYLNELIEKFGFQPCGNIYVRNGSERIAYDYMSTEYITSGYRGTLEK